jgi:hypothetical protein
MANPPFDFRPQVRIDPQSFIRQGDPWGTLEKGLQSAMEKRKQNKILNQLVQAMQNQGAPQQGPQPEGVGTEPGMTPPTSGMGAPPQDNTQQIQSLMMKYNPEMAMRMMPTPLQQSEIAKNLAMAQKYTTGGPTGQPLTSVWRNIASGEVTDVEPEDKTGWKKYDVKPGQALQTVTQLPLQRKAAEAREEWSKAWTKRIDVNQINQIVKNVGLTPKMQSQLQQNTMRALRAYIPILSRPKITYQELALGEIDLAGIMQGGVPHVDEVHNTHFPGWQEKWANIKTYAEGHPQEMVPDAIRLKVRQMVGDVVKIDNTFLQANRKFTEKMLGPTLTGGLKPGQKQAIGEMVGTLTPALGEKEPLTPKYDPQKEARYQAWRKSHGY